MRTCEVVGAHRPSRREVHDVFVSGENLDFFFASDELVDLIAPVEAGNRGAEDENLFGAKLLRRKDTLDRFPKAHLIGEVFESGPVIGEPLDA